MIMLPKIKKEKSNKELREAYTKKGKEDLIILEERDVH